jgi:ribonucleoside-diphosphate reductase alpha chain|tara:strand:- start:13711 stop:15660 length:1950 start_codon:yes stop_codon:yes gene_type:complete
MNNYLPTDYQAFIHTSRYARWLPEEGRRETWSETVGRYVKNIVAPVISDVSIQNEISEAITGLEVMPSMRSMMTAGTAANRDNTCMYNCSYLVIDDPKAFDEAMFILLCGTGVGFSCERQYIKSLPEVPELLFESDSTIVVKDSKEGWAKAYRLLISMLYAGEVPKWDVSNVRPAGARLKTFGGRASGPAPLVDLFNFTVDIFKKAAGGKLSSYECHSIMCKIGEVVVVGGVRRSAMISLSNLSDDRMRYAKSGKWFETAPHMGLANNSVAYTEKPDAMAFLREWTALAESGSGERGIFNREAATKQAAKNGRRDPNREWGTNPCSEILLAGPRTDKNGNPIAGTGGQFCNLSEVVVRATDTKETLAEKVRIATILGTVQSTYTKFPYLRKVWAKNTAEERLLGVSLTGIMDNTLTNGKEGDLAALLEDLKQIAVDTNKEWADKLGIEVSAAISCCKPSGTVSQLVDSSSGIHARHSPYYIRTVRGDNKDPLTQFMMDQGIPSEPEAYKPDQTTVFSFPMKAPEGSVVTADMSAIDQLNMWLMYQRHWCEHKPSVTVNVKADEWMEVGAFVYEHFDEMSGVSFLPFDDHTYQQAPYQHCGKSEYEQMLSFMPKSIDWTKLSAYETEDNTSGSQTMACSGDSCEIVDLTA